MSTKDTATAAAEAAAADAATTAPGERVYVDPVTTQVLGTVSELSPEEIVREQEKQKETAQLQESLREEKQTGDAKEDDDETTVENDDGEAEVEGEGGVKEEAPKKEETKEERSFRIVGEEEKALNAAIVPYPDEETKNFLDRVALMLPGRKLTQVATLLMQFRGIKTRLTEGWKRVQAIERQVQIDKHALASTTGSGKEKRERDAELKHRVKQLETLLAEAQKSLGEEVKHAATEIQRYCQEAGPLMYAVSGCFASARAAHDKTESRLERAVIQHAYEELRTLFIGFRTNWDARNPGAWGQKMIGTPNYDLNGARSDLEDSVAEKRSPQLTMATFVGAVHTLCVLQVHMRVFDETVRLLESIPAAQLVAEEANATIEKVFLPLMKREDKTKEMLRASSDLSDSIFSLAISTCNHAHVEHSKMFQERAKAAAAANPDAKPEDAKPLTKEERNELHDTSIRILRERAEETAKMLRE